MLLPLLALFLRLLLPLLALFLRLLLPLLLLQIPLARLLLTGRLLSLGLLLPLLRLLLLALLLRPLALLVLPLRTPLARLLRAGLLFPGLLLLLLLQLLCPWRLLCGPWRSRSACVGLRRLRPRRIVTLHGWLLALLLSICLPLLPLRLALLAPRLRCARPHVAIERRPSRHLGRRPGARRSACWFG